MENETPTEVLKKVIEDIISVENSVNESRDVKDLFSKTDPSDETETIKIIKETKTVVDNLKLKVTKVFNLFEENYSKWKKEFHLPNDNACIPNSNVSDVIKDSSLKYFCERCKTEIKEQTDNLNEIDAVANGTDSSELVMENSDSRNKEQCKKVGEVSENCINDKNETESDVLNNVNTNVHKELVNETETHTQLNENTASECVEQIQNLENIKTVEEKNDSNISTDVSENTESNQSGNASGIIDNIQSTVESLDEDKSDADQKQYIKCIDISKLIEPNLKPALNKMPQCGSQDAVVISSDSDSSSNLLAKKDKKMTRNKTKVNIDKNNETTRNRTTSNTNKENNKRQTRSYLIKTTLTDKFSIIREEKERKKNNCNVSNNDNKISAKSVSNKTAKQQDKVSQKLKKDLLTVSVVSSSTDSDSEKEFVNSKKRLTKSSSKSRAEGNTNENIQCDKFTWQAYVPLVRYPCENLKEIYLQAKEKREIDRLTNLENLKKTRRNPSPSKSSSDSDNPKRKSKRSRKTTSNVEKSESDDINNTDTSLTSSDPINTTMDVDSEIGVPGASSTVDAKALLDGIKSGTDSSDGESTHSNGEDKDTKKRKQKEKKTEDDSSLKEPDHTSASNNEDENKTLEENEGNSAEKPNAELKSDDEATKSKKKWRKDKLLTDKLSESDSEEDLKRFTKKKDKLREEARNSSSSEGKIKHKVKRAKRKFKNKIASDDDSDDSLNKKGEKKKKSKEDSKWSSESSDSSSDSSTESVQQQKKRRRIKHVKSSSSDDENEKSTRKSIRKMWSKSSLEETTKQAEKEERERKARILDKQKKYNQLFDGEKPEDSTVEKVVLDFNEETKEELLSVDKNIVKHLKPHQAKGIQFMWNACYESIERVKSTDGSGCILAHCMGLGKTLQVIALVFTLLTNEEKTRCKRVLVICPLSTVLNWVAEFNKWLADVTDSEIEVFDLVSHKSNEERHYQTKCWLKEGGVMILGYDMFRNLSNPKNGRISRAMKNTYQTAFVDPGPDLVVCDEGHLLKNEKTSLSIATNRLKTARRIVLTGTPMQNNLKEYYCMVQFIKPNLLGTFKEYMNRFVNPITNGQYTDSTPHDINIMRKRSHILHKMLDGVVQRKDYGVLAPFLPPKHEYILFVNLTEVQIKLYRHYMQNFAQQTNANNNRSSFLFTDFQELQRICTHPRVLLDKSLKMKKELDKDGWLEDEEESEGSLKDFVVDDSDEKSNSDSSDNEKSSHSSHHSDEPVKSKRRTRANAGDLNEEEEKIKNEGEPEWWQQFCDDDALDKIQNSHKLSLLFQILQQCEQIGDKILIFSQSLYSLNVIEYFLGKVDEETSKGSSCGGFTGSWSLGLDYFRLDGSSKCDDRSAWCKIFNSPSNTRARLFLISTKAGGLGINLVGANRVIIFDVSWNPSHDIQSIYRVFRFGQTKPCYIYRFATLGTMEMKIYERQVTKQAISKRVIDEQQIDRHYNQNDLSELYKFEPKPDEERPIPLVPKDVLLGELLQNFADHIYKYHEHHTLLENKVDEVLNEEERKAAWEEFENEKTARKEQGGMVNNMGMGQIIVAVKSLVRKDNPEWTFQQVQSVVPALVQKLRDEVSNGIYLTYNRIVSEIQLLQYEQEQHNIKEYIRHQQMRLLQMQQLKNMQMAASTSTNMHANDIIELND